MPRLPKMFVEPANLSLPPSVWLHVSGVSLTTEVPPYQPPAHTYDYRTQHLQSPVQPPTPPAGSPATVVPCSVTIINGPYSNSTSSINKQEQKLENGDMSKRFFIDRHIKKAKSLPGLIKGTALSRQTPLQPSTFASPVSLNPSTNTLQDDHLPMVTIDNDDDSLPNQSMDFRPRPRVFFAEFDKIQIIDPQNDESQKNGTSTNYSHRRHRRRLTKKTSTTIANNQTSPSIQQTQILQNLSHPLSRQPAQELRIKKQQLFISPRVQSSRITTQLPDILNQSLSTETALNDSFNRKHLLQREKPISRLAKAVIEIPIALPRDTPSEERFETNSRATPTSDSHPQNFELESNETVTNVSMQHTASISQTSMNRSRPSLRTISLRQQFISPPKSKSTAAPSATITNYYFPQQPNNSSSNPHRSASLKHSILRATDDVDDPRSTQGSLIATESNLPLAITRSVKTLKRSDAIHFNSKNPFAGSSNNEPTKHQVQQTTPKRFQNLLTVVRPPYGGGNGTASTNPSPLSNASTTQAIQPQHPPIKGTPRPARSTSAREQFRYPFNPNTVVV